jgi:putative ABC transport system permease protein
MLRLSVKSVRGHLVRFLLTALAVTLGVAFVAGSFVLRDSIDATLSNLLDSAARGTDVAVRGARAGQDAPRQYLLTSLADKVATVDGVAQATPNLQGVAMIVGKDGTVVRNGGAPTFGFAFRDGDPSFHLIAGRGPTDAGEIVVEKTTLEKSGLAVGGSTRAVVAGRLRTVRITGEVEFGSLFGATAILIDEPSARALFAPDGKVDMISVQASPGVSQTELRSRVAAVLPAGAEAITGQALADESRTAIQQGLGFFTTFLLVFAGITLFVGAFIIVNTFSILLAQRTRELALLRAVGASRGQVVRMVLGEAVLIGLLGSGLGLAAGVGLASTLKVLMKSLVGVDISGGIPVGVGTVLWSVLIGTVVTLVSAVLPARRASRIPPVAAMREDMVVAPSRILRRGVVGIVILLLGAALLTWSVLPDDARWVGAGFGAAMMLLGALVAAPLAARPVVRVIAWPFTRFGGVVGRLAGQNALRVPRRTANTASALMIGLTLVSGLGVVAQSIKASVSDLIAAQLTSDFVLTTGGQQPVPADVTSGAARLPGVRSATALTYLELKVGPDPMSAAVSTAAGLTDNVRVQMLSGSIDAMDAGQVLVNETTATKKDWQVGTSVDLDIGPLAGQHVTIGGIYHDNALLDSPFVVGRGWYDKALPAAERNDYLVMVKAQPGADLAALRASLRDLVKPYLVVSVQDGSEYVDSAAGQIDQVLGLLYALLALAILIAILGIINTLALSVVERTREIGLLRAVGLRRAQLSRMITLEAVATAVFGAVLGAALGLGLGTAFQHALRSQGLDVLSVPWATIVVVLLASGVVGVIAAVMPAVRAVRLDILRAIATE